MPIFSFSCLGSSLSPTTAYLFMVGWAHICVRHPRGMLTGWLLTYWVDSGGGGGRASGHTHTHTQSEAV